MHEIICPHCDKTFKVDETGFADILKQVRDDQFDKEVHDRLVIAEKEQESAVKLAEANLKNSLQEDLAKKEAQIAEMKAKIDNAEVVKQLSVTQAVNSVEKERDDFKNKLRNKVHEMELREVSL